LNIWIIHDTREKERPVFDKRASPSSANQLGEPLYKNSQQQVKILQAPSKPEINIHASTPRVPLVDEFHSQLINHPAERGAFGVYIFFVETGGNNKKMLRVPLYYFDFRFKMQI
jgi:hypothetical protein